MDNELIARLEHSHDLRLPEWGPYTKKYAGISHLPDVRSGLRFDLSVFPGYYRRQVLVPNSKWESGFHPWEANADLSYFAYRYELEWKDQVYCDISFSEMGPKARLVRSEYVNNTDIPQNVVLHYMTAMNYPPLRTYSDEPIHLCRMHLPPGALWIDSLDYVDLKYAIPRPQDSLGYDGLWRSEIRGHGFVNGSGVGNDFGRDAGDWVQYKMELTAPMTEALLLIRYRAPDGSARFVCQGLASGEITFPESVDFSQVHLQLGDLPAGECSLSLTSRGEAPIELDGFVLITQALAGQVRFELRDWNPVPEILDGPRPNSLVLQYADTPTCYGLAWLGEPWELRQLHTDELDRFLRYYVQEHVRKVMFGNGLGHFCDVFIRPIELLPHQSRSMYGMVCSGDQDEVVHALAGFPTSSDVCSGVYLKAKSQNNRIETTLAGERYRFSQERMAATVLTNVVYPVYTRRSYIRHYTPGKWWDCLYTWDSGFIGLGLLELDPERAIDCLNAYTTPPGDPQAAFLHHGSLVPVQHYLFLELWNRTQDRALLEYFYPRLRQYYRFFAGRLGSSTTRTMKSGLLKTWDYFYNSGGWDDYPPQVFVHQNNLEGSTTPVISTAHGLRIAKILQMAARAVGEAGDVQEYQADIDTWTDALNRHSWDEQAGYFSYVRHDPGSQPLGFLRHATGQNYNMGLDGASPFFAGVCNPEQYRSILEHLFSPEHLWTPIGLCTVDKTAAYYRIDGYWNGAVWYPQQWFLWKALLDGGQAVSAELIARTALETWKAEVDASYHCFEHFIVQSGRGAGWHQFGGLSTPVLIWNNAYHHPGRLTAGFDTWIRAYQFHDYNSRLSAEVEYHGKKDVSTLLAVMDPGWKYQALWNGRLISLYERYPGALEITLDGKDAQGKLEICPITELIA